MYYIVGRDGNVDFPGFDKPSKAWEHALELKKETGIYQFVWMPAAASIFPQMPDFECYYDRENEVAYLRVDCNLVRAFDWVQESDEWTTFKTTQYETVEQARKQYDLLTGKKVEAA